MNIKKLYRKTRLYIDFKIYYISWKLHIKYGFLLLKYIKDEEKRYRILANYIFYHPFSSRFETPIPNITELLKKGNKKK